MVASLLPPRIPQTNYFESPLMLNGDMKNRKIFHPFIWKTKNFSIHQNQEDFKETGNFEIF